MKSERQLKIIELIQNNEVKNQKELMDLLRRSGFHATQATVSRDIHDLQLIKVPSDKGYSYFTERNSSSPAINFQEISYNEEYVSKIEKIFKESVLSIKHNNFLIVINTLPGMAQAAAHAIDTINWNSILGTIAGDDTIFIAIKDSHDIDKLLKKFNDLMEQD